MFLDSGNIISDETFYAQSQIMVEKVPEFSAESLCLRQGRITSGRWCHMTLLDHVTPVGRGRPGVQEEDQGGHQNTPREA